MKPIGVVRNKNITMRFNIKVYHPSKMDFPREFDQSNYVFETPAVEVEADLNGNMSNTEIAEWVFHATNAPASLLSRSCMNVAEAFQEAESMCVSVGDIIEVGEERLFCAPLGFKSVK